MEEHTSIPSINASLIQAGTCDEGPTLTFAVTQEDLQFWIKQSGGLPIYNPGKLAFIPNVP